MDPNGRRRNFALSMIAKGDTNHLQPFFLEVGTDNSILVSGNAATTSMFAKQRGDTNLWSYWNKLTFTYTYNETSSASVSNMYINGSLSGTLKSTGKIMRWSDSSTMILGGYSLGTTSVVVKNRFLGWIDDLAFYNRTQTAAEIATNWNDAVNTSDSSLFIYYNFDEGPDSSVIKNLAQAGSQADLYNGQVFGDTSFLDTVSDTTQTATAAKWVSNQSPITDCSIVTCIL
jgi:hypothetical protein